MNILAFMTTLVSPLTKYIQGKQSINQAKVEAQIKLIQDSAEADTQADTSARVNAGWMDDVSFYIFLSPAVLVFYPPALPHIIQGFKALESTPQWWQMALGMMLVSVWGYRKLVSPIIQSIAKAYLGKSK